MPLYSYGADAPKSLSDIVTMELDTRWSRERGIMAPRDGVIPMGAVLALDANDKYVPYMTELAPHVPAAGENPAVPATYADKAVAVLISLDLTPGGEEQLCSVLRRGACVAAGNLFWVDGVTEQQKQTAMGQLAAIGVVPKE
jgi:hypothetical protein